MGFGVGLGLISSELVGRAFSRMLFGLGPADPLSLTGASGAWTIVAQRLCWHAILPAFNARRVNPMETLREDSDDVSEL